MSDELNPAASPQSETPQSGAAVPAPAQPPTAAGDAPPDAVGPEAGAADASLEGATAAPDISTPSTPHASDAAPAETAAADASPMPLPALDAGAGGSRAISPAGDAAAGAALAAAARSATSTEATATGAGPPLGSIELLDDVELDVRVELGRTEMYIDDVLKLGAGSVVELDKLAGDPVDVYVNDRLVARGEVLVLNENFCVRINDILSPAPGLEPVR
jgi:flagellar motor switch protein FliN/FliY